MPSLAQALNEPESRQAQEALQLALRALERAEACGRPWTLTEALARLGRCYRRLALHGAAQHCFERALRWSVVSGGGDQAVEVLCELSEACADEADAADQVEPGSGRAARERARDHVFDATRRASHVADPTWEVTVLLRLSDVLDRFGDREDATVLQVRALRLTAGATLPAERPTADDAATARRH
jgi:tetratricopeptide (TPR) repeat protein